MPDTPAASASEIAAENAAGACRGGICGCSFGEETSIETEAGPRSMADLAPGDRVWALDEDTGEWGFHEVLDVTVHPGHALALELIDDEAGASGVLVVTENHPLYERTRGWTQVGDLLPGDEVFTSRGGWARIGAGTWIEQEQLLYDLEVEGAHTYFVGETGAWAHNCPEFGASGGGARFHSARLADHFERHGGDFGAQTEAEYEEMAARFLSGPRGEGVLERTRPNGDVVRFDPRTDAFGVISEGGTIRTYYRPSPAVHGRASNLEYFNAQ